MKKSSRRENRQSGSARAKATAIAQAWQRQDATLRAAHGNFTNERKAARARLAVEEGRAGG